MVIVVGYSPAPAGHAALRLGLDEARLRGGRVVVVNSSRGDAPVDKRYVTPDEVAGLERELDESGVSWTLRQPVRGHDACEEILAVALEVGADLIVVGLRHRSPVGKLIMGSTAQGVLLDAACPVLTVKAEGA